MVRLLLVRHGETVGNVARQLQDDHDPLTERGRRQAREVAAFLARRGDLRALYASPLARAFETARIIGEATALEPELRPGLAEINVGTAAGLTFDEWGARFPDQLRDFRADGVAFAWPGGESGRDIATRVAAEIDWVVARHRDDPGAVVIVSHGGALAWAIVHLLREPGDRWPREHMRIDNCALTEVELDPDRWLAGEPATFLCRNEIGHLTVEEEASHPTAS
jgi:broad specificity phosphatase PhoE